MPQAAHQFREFWAKKTSPMSRCQGPVELRLAAEELRLLLVGRSPVDVLEIGCGTGALFDFLGFPSPSYRGLDFSPLMLEVFRRNHPELDLVEAEGSTYLDERLYDLIFAHDVMAHFTPAMLERHCRNARKMMKPESLLIWASVPWRPLRRRYDLGLFSDTGSASALRWGKNWITRALGRDWMGRWYGIPEIARIARRNGFQARFHGSISHPYRFHAVLSL